MSALQTEIAAALVTAFTSVPDAAIAAREGER